MNKKQIFHQESKTSYAKYSCFGDDKKSQYAETDWFAGETFLEHHQLKTNST